MLHATTRLAFWFEREELNRLGRCDREIFITTKITSFILLMITVHSQRIMNYANMGDILVLPVQRDVHMTVSTISLLGNLMFVGPCIIVQVIKKNPTRCNKVSKFYYSLFIWSSTCFGRHTAHHQEPKTALAASSFSYVEGCWPLSGPGNVHQLHVQQPSTYAKPEAASAVLGS
jgi:hypothetical protein